MELRKLEKFRPIILDIETTFPKAFKIVKKKHISPYFFPSPGKYTQPTKILSFIDT